PANSPSPTVNPNKISEQEYRERKESLDQQLEQFYEEIDYELEQSLEYLENEKERYDTSRLERELENVNAQKEAYQYAVTTEGKNKYNSTLDDIDYVEQQIKNIEISIQQIENQQDDLVHRAENEKRELKAEYDKLIADLE